MGRRAIGEDRIDRAHVVHHVAVADRARAAGIVRGHAADRRAIAGRDIDREPQFVLAQPGIEPFHDHAGLDFDPPRRSVDFPDALHVFATFDDERAVYRLPALRGAAAARQYRHAFLAGDLDRGRDVALILGDENAQRLHLVDRRVGRITTAVEAVAQHVALDLATQAFFQAGCRGIVERHGFARGRSASYRRRLVSRAGLGPGLRRDDEEGAGYAAKRLEY